MTVLHVATILYSCPCGQDHTLRMESDHGAVVRTAIEGVAESLARHSKMVRLTTWWQEGSAPTRRKVDMATRLVQPPPPAHNR